MSIDKESGHALVEVLLLGLILLVPITWLLSVFAELHGAALATSSAARARLASKPLVPTTPVPPTSPYRST